MFKLESYITPILLDYLSKYVKNVRQEDLQVSLWEGEVALHNLDLRLDVLQEEINLPLEFLSGHIHDLSIRVPWTKITSEPITITINTIEFVLKLKNPGKDGTASSTNSPNSRSSESKRKRKYIAKTTDERPVNPEGSSSWIVSKIINNISLQCHNIILKYIEEEIVVSMNVQLLSFSSANEKWESAMIDVHPVKVLMRKLVQISDLTICLDKRNAAGQIDVCQEPILYRSSLECRILLKYNANNPQSNRITRIGLFTKLLDMNISSMQIPLCLRLVKLTMAVKHRNRHKTAAVEALEDGPEEEETQPQDQSYLAWAWNMLPSINFAPGYEDEPTNETPCHTIDVGFYAEQLSFTLKNAEFVTETHMTSTKRIRYSPIVRLTIGGMFLEFVSAEARNWTSAKAGVTFISIEPLGSFKSNDGNFVQTFKSTNLRPFLDKSLFDDKCLIADKGWGVTNYAEYSARFTDDYLLYRSPTLALDFIQYKIREADRITAKDSGAILGNAIDANRIQYRLLTAGITFRYTQALEQVKQLISDFITSYDYPAYYTETLDGGSSHTGANSSKLPPPLMEDYDALMQHIPLRTYKLSIKNLTIEAYAKSEMDTVAALKQRVQRESQSQPRIHANVFRTTSTSQRQPPPPHCMIYVASAEGSMETPLFPDKLVHTTCQLPDKPRQLLNACYEKYEMDFRDFSCSLVNHSEKRCSRVLNIPNFTVKYETLLQPQNWKEENLELKKFNFQCEKIYLNFTRREWNSSIYLYQSIDHFNPSAYRRLVRLEASDLAAEDCAVLKNRMIGCNVRWKLSMKQNIWSLNLYTMESVVAVKQKDKLLENVVFGTKPIKGKLEAQRWLECDLLFPIEVGGKKQKSKTSIAFWMAPFFFNIDTNILTFLRDCKLKEMENECDAETMLYNQTLNAAATFQSNASVQSSALILTSQTSQPPPPQPPPPIIRRSSRHSLQRKISHPEETIHLSSERDDKLEKDTSTSTSPRLLEEKNGLMSSWLSFINSFIVYSEIESGAVYIADDLNSAKVKTKIILPRIHLRPSSLDPTKLVDLSQLQYISMSSKEKSNISWTLALSDFGILSEMGGESLDAILQPIQTTVTIALLFRNEKFKSTALEIKEENEPPLSLSQNDKISAQKEAAAILASSNTRAAVSPIGSDYLSSASATAGERSDKDLQENAETELIIGTAWELQKPPLEKHSPKRVRKNRIVYTFNLHADTTPLRLFISSQKIHALESHLAILMEFIQSYDIPQKPGGNSQAPIEQISIVTATEEHALLKEFMDLETNSENSKYSDDKKDVPLVMLMFCQWTITRITLEVEANHENNHRSKVIIDLEDLLSTLDKREDYTKCTSKMGNFNVTYHEGSPNGEWTPADCLTIRLLGEITNLPFLNVIYTAVGLKHFFKRIGVKRKGDMNRNLNEILIKMQAFEMIVDLDRISKFVRAVCGFFEKCYEKRDESLEETPEKLRRVNAAHELPMIHLDSKGFALYLPFKKGRDFCSVAIFRVQSIRVTPNLENPLQRKPLRADIFSKAAQLGMLGTPGAMIEDRQYELTLENISAASGNWNQISKHMTEQRDNFLHTNPAFEWNNQNRRQDLHITDIFQNFCFVAIFAPAIVYQNILISGQAIEFNCATDYVASLNRFQLNMISCLIIYVQNILGYMKGTEKRSNQVALLPRPRSKWATSLSVLPKNSPRLSSKLALHSVKRSSSHSRELRTSFAFKSIEEDADNLPTSDSGFQSCASQLMSSDRLKGHRSSISAISPHPLSYAARNVPQTVSLVAGVFLIKLYDLQTNDNDGESDESSMVQKPLFSVTFSQPSFMFTQSVYESNMQVALYDFFISLATTTSTSPSSSALDFNDVVVDTRPGQANAAGITPSLFTFRVHRTKMKLRECDIELAKQIELLVTENKIKLLIQHILFIYKTLLEDACFEVRSKRNVTRGSKIKLMRQQCLDADRLHVTCRGFIVRFQSEDESYHCKLVATDMNFNMKFLNRPEKAMTKASIGALYFLVNRKAMLHPVNIRLSAEFISEPWHQLPLLTAIIKFNALHLDVGINSVLHLQAALKGYYRMTNDLQAQWQKFLLSRPFEQDLAIDSKRVKLIKWPRETTELKKKSSKASLMRREEFYQDDLRAGAFQYVEMNTDTFLPMPYQIQIIKINFGIICWRYPQPRKMNKIHVYPVPMALPNPIHIRCRMEYYSEVHETFLHFCDFALSETVSKQIQLPQRQICANIWRVVIVQSLISVNGECFEDFTTDDGENPKPTRSIKIEDIFSTERKESDFILHPKVLVGCMRIDTTFESTCVPKIQLLLSCNFLTVKLLNQPNQGDELPSELRKYKLVQATEISQSFLVADMHSINVHTAMVSSDNYTIESNVACGIKCLDYGYLNMLPLLEETAIQGCIRVEMPKPTTEKEISVNLVLDRMRLNLGPTIIHSLYTSKMHWDEFLGRENTRRHMLIPRCIIVNRTYTYLTFGQTGTTERIQLQVSEACLYSFRSEYHNQELTFFIADAETEMTEASQPVPISLKFNGEVQVQAVRVGKKCIFIKSRKLSPMQIYVLIKGQIELISMIPHDLRLDFRSENNGSSKRSIEYLVNGEEHACFYYSVERKSNIKMRLKFADNATISRARSGDIPLRSNKNLPWLVKIPHAKFEFVSFWVRVFREDVKELITDNFEPQKILVTIWPIYEICSMLPLKAEAKEAMTLEELHLLPEGRTQALPVPATHLTEHVINFNFNHEISRKSTAEFILTLKKLDWKDFFYYDENFWGVEAVIEELAKDDESKWPCNDAEELRLRRSVEAPNYPAIVYSSTPSRQLSCTLHLEVSAWGYFINSTSMTVGIRQQETNESLTVQSNGLQMLFEINKYFTLQLEHATEEWVETAPIYLQDAINSTPTNNPYYLLSKEMPLDIVILGGSEIIKFVVSLQIENNRRILILRSKFVVTNFTKRSICVLPFAMDHKETATREHVEILDAKVAKLEAQPTASKDDSIGIAVDHFYDLASQKAKRSIDTAFVCFVCIKISCDSDISIPIPLSMPFTRRCFSSQNGAESVAFAATLFEHNGIYYLNVFEDVAPALLINNETDMQFLIAQTNASENSKVNSTTPEYLGRNFEWFQLLKSYSDCYYTPPEMYLNFPDVDSAICNLTLALYKDKISKRDIKWSKPIRADKSWEKFLHIPNHGDVKIIICDKHRVIRVSIFYILQQREFSVKDLRSRLLTTQPTSVESEDSFDSIATQPNSPSINPKHRSVGCIHHREGLDDKPPSKNRFRLHVYVKEIVFTLHTDDEEHEFIKNEVFSIYVDDFLLAYDDDYKLGPHNRSLNLLFTNLQIDNQLHSNGKFDFPVIICAQELYARMTTMPQAHYLDLMHEDACFRTPMIAIKLKFYDDEIRWSLSEINCSMSPFRAYIEDAYLNELFDAIVECLPSNCVHIPKPPLERIDLSAGQTLLPREVAAQAICIAEPLQLRSFRIEPLHVLLSVHTSVRLYIALDHSPLSFSSYQRQQILTVPLRFGQSLGMHYLSGAIFGAGWVVGSLEILGSPSGLARSFTTGLRDFVAMPVQGLFRGPWGFVVGVTQGSASLLRNVTAGTVNSLTKLAASVARNLDRLSLDREHIERTEALRRVRPNSLTEGFSQGLTGLGISILGAVGGIAHHTLEARSPAEVVAGVGKGIVGAFTKPISGAAELVALTGHGVLQTVGFNALPKQRQPSGIHNSVSEPSAYRIWKLLPSVLGTDQVLFYHEITLSVQNQMRSAYIFLTSTVFAILITKWDKLELAYPVNKVEITRDREDKSLFFLRLVQEDADEQQNNLSYTTERIMSFLRSSLSSKESVRFSTNSLNESLHTQDQQIAHRNLHWAFYINDHLGEHLMQYLKILANEI